MQSRTGFLLIDQTLDRRRDDIAGTILADTWRGHRIQTQGVRAPPIVRARRVYPETLSRDKSAREWSARHIYLDMAHKTSRPPASRTALVAGDYPHGRFARTDQVEFGLCQFRARVGLRIGINGCHLAEP